MHCNPQLQDRRNYIDALLRNNTVLLNELYHNFYPAIKRMVVKYKGNDSDAADVFQEALIALYNSAKKGTLVMIGNFGSYLYRTCRNIWISQVKKRGRLTELHPAVSDRLGRENNADGESDEWQAARVEMFEAAVTKLPPRSREIMQLRGSGKSISEIAGLLNLTNGYVRKKICTTVKRLKGSMVCAPAFAF